MQIVADTGFINLETIIIFFLKLTRNIWTGSRQVVYTNGVACDIDHFHSCPGKRINELADVELISASIISLRSRQTSTTCLEDRPKITRRSRSAVSVASP